MMTSAEMMTWMKYFQADDVDVGKRHVTMMTSLMMMNLTTCVLMVKMQIEKKEKKNNMKLMTMQMKLRKE